MGPLPNAVTMHGRARVVDVMVDPWKCPSVLMMPKS